MKPSIPLPDVQGTAVACRHDALAKPDRVMHFSLGRSLFSRRRIERLDLVDGFAFRFVQDDFADLARFVENERRCCPFLRIELELVPNGKYVDIRLSGPPGTRDVLESELGLVHDRPAICAFE